MESSVGRSMIVILFFIGFTQAASPSITGKVPDRAYTSVDENYIGELFRIHVEDSDKDDHLAATGNGDVTRQYFNISTTSSSSNDIWVHVYSRESDLDRELLGDNVKVLLSITDDQGNQISYQFTVYIQDVNDNPPVFHNQPYNLDIPELPFNETTVVYNQIYATDNDKNENGRVSYSMEANAQSDTAREEYTDTFRIDINTGSISQTKCLNYADNTYYQFTIMAKDGGPNGGLNATADFIIRVKDVQNQPPFFTGTPYRQQIDENKEKGSSVLTINARDGDTGVSNKVNYTITNCSCGDDLFDINKESGLITTKTELDRDNGTIKKQSGNCNLDVLVEEIDHGLEQWGNTTASTTVTIIVNDIDDNPPEFEEEKYIADVKENTPKDSLLTLNKTIGVHDYDQGDNARMKITLENMDNSPCTDFVASPSEIQGRGNVFILVNNSTLLDYEKLSDKTLYIQVVATESDNDSVVAKANLEINVLDANDNYPTFNSTKFNISIPENTKNNLVISQITANDADTYPDFKDITYSVSGGSGRFTVDNVTGEIRTHCSQDCSKELDREMRSDFYLTLFAQNKGGNRNSTEVIVILTDMNDNEPQFSRPTYTVFLKENSANLDVVTVDASDRDQKNTNNSKLTYKIIDSTDEGLKNNLTINKTTGEITLNTILDYEVLKNPKGTVNITVQVKDDGTPSLNRTCEVKVTIQDENDNAPIFNQTIYYGKVAEDQSSNINFTTNVTRVYATDKDVTEQNKHLSYFKTAGSDKFSVDSSTGIIRITMGSKLDKEALSEYNLTIIAIDQGSPPLTGTTTVTINVTDVNDEKPKFNSTEYTASVKENSTNHNKIIQTCHASDPDLDSSLIYNITEVEARDENGKSVNESLVKDYFDIHENNGSVFVSGTLDRETASTVRLRIQVTDTNAVHNKPQTDFANLRITLMDINDNFPTFEKTQYNISVSEGAEKGRKYDGPKASDRDVNRTITYKLQPGNHPIDSFNISDKTGEIVKVGALDRETNSSFILTVFATDNGVPPLNSSVFVNVNVLDVNDNAPEFSNESSSSNTVHINENTPTGKVIIIINATDKDEGPNSNITYFLEQNDYFAIDETDGVISVTKSPDREVISQIKLTIFAKDNPISTNAQKTSSMTITVYFDDVNDNSPTFASQHYYLAVEEDKQVGSVIIRVSATDQDQTNTNNSKISYHIEDSTLNKFSIDENTGDININSSLVDHVGNYTITIVAYDHGGPQRNGSTTVNVTVTDKNRHPPVIGHLPADNKINIYECARDGTVIHRFNYTDADFGVNAAASFNISTTTLDDVTNVFSLTEDGSLTVVGKLDVNIKPSYTFQIVAIDHGIPPLTSDGVQITVDIKDVDDHAPSFQKDKVRFTIQENMVSNSAIGSVTAYDKDTDSKSCYKVEGNMEKLLFNVSESDGTGYIFILQQFDYEKNQTIKFNISVKDCSTAGNISDYCDKDENQKIQRVKEEINSTIEVIIDVVDINDNPPVFKKNQFATGMRRDTEADVELELHLRNETYISDADSPKNGILSWIFSNYGNITISPDLRGKIQENTGARPCDDGVKIYLISDSQVVTMTIRDNKGKVAEFKDELLQELSSILGHTAVFDSLLDHKENGEINTQSSDLNFHIVDTVTKAVLPGDDAIQLFDKYANTGQMIALQNNYNVITVSKQTMTDNADETGSEKLTFILVAISVAEGLIIATIIFIALSARTKFRRKLKAAVITTQDMEMHALDQKEAAIPGSNMYSKQNNPLFNIEVVKNVQEVNIDSNSISSADDVDLDVNDVDDPNTVYDKLEEREVTLDMYTDDTVNNVSSEDLLGAALLHHAMRKSKENLDTLDDTDESHQSTDNPAAFTNDAYSEELESTEI